VLQEHVPLLVAEVRLKLAALFVGGRRKVEAEVGQVTHHGGLLPPTTV
jgi:hypothetical protein